MILKNANFVKSVIEKCQLATVVPNRMRLIYLFFFKTLFFFNQCIDINPVMGAPDPTLGGVAG